jgi:hypothetical protein
VNLSKDNPINIKNYSLLKDNSKISKNDVEEWFKARDNVKDKEYLV